MKILVFEFITGGGFSQEELPKSLAKEGLMMLEILIGELAVLASVELTVLLDFRIKLLDLPKGVRVVRVESGQSVYTMLPQLIELSDWVWPIAPEMNSELEKISALVVSKKKKLLNSSLDAVVLCGDKFLTYQMLKSKGIAVVDTQELNNISPKFPEKWVVKPKEGVGCLSTYLVTNKALFEELMLQIECKDYIFQPYIEGEALSLSCLFKDRAGWLLCCNRQKMLNEQNQFKLSACEVNIKTENLAQYQNLVDQVSAAIPGLWGYVGIDIIQPKEAKPLILEINPRLTTSYVGIHQAIGVNVAQVVLEMIQKKPQISRANDKTITVSI